MRIAALGETRDPHALDLLLPLLKDLDTTVRRAAAKAAILTFDPRAVEPVLALTYSNDVDEQTSVCVALREQSSDPRVHARFVELSKDPHAQLRSAIGSILNAASDRQDISDF